MARRRKPAQQCLNCGTALHTGDHYCPHCGQENHDLRVPFKHFALEFLEGLTHFDTKLWSTLKLIFTKPGQLTKDFVEGKRARYVKPAQFYVFVSVIFYALLSHAMDRGIDEQDGAFELNLNDGPHARIDAILPDSTLDTLHVDSVVRRLQVPITAPYYRQERERLTRDTDHQLAHELHAIGVDTSAAMLAQVRTTVAALPQQDGIEMPYTVSFNGHPFTFRNKMEEEVFRARLRHYSDAQLDSLLRVSGTRYPTWVDRRLLRTIGSLDTHTPAGRKQLLHAMMKAVSIAMFVLMPFTAVLLLWIFFRKRYYWEHLIFSIHTHTIYFLFFSILLLIGYLLPHGFSGVPDGVFGWACIGCLIYLLFALRRVYGRSWGATILRFLVMAVPYFIALFLLLLVGAAWGIIAA